LPACLPACLPATPHASAIGFGMAVVAGQCTPTCWCCDSVCCCWALGWRVMASPLVVCDCVGCPCADDWQCSGVIVVVWPLFVLLSLLACLVALVTCVIGALLDVISCALYVQSQSPYGGRYLIPYRFRFPCLMSLYNLHTCGCYIVSIVPPHYGAVVNTPLLRSEARELQCDTETWLQLYLADTNFVRGPEKPLPASYFLCCLRADQCQYAIEAQTAESIV